MSTTAIFDVGMPLIFTYTLTGIIGLLDKIVLHFVEGTVSLNKNNDSVGAEPSG
ncbi:TPA: hypothetical protein PP061_003924 [Salmonella bongori]|uniref:Uncharacterized protein n=1 Tax=Salmonella bongori N268-08 TaxID=1197719 RepID=S5N512_SALBN|nr:hypothetical protein [Salmonella bongori]AGR61954.1 hypothetical protein A464_plas0130 [Salmonella bongori N268-08]EDP8577362.1 hypothetical protein [Salmonella bongori]EDP8593730.1 hypothetical protein [Salmonella bongori]EDP8599387.1 hypothetical protein [Salmonella bongori]EDP8686310.1 hypothetical protein [Salmonella bongori]